MVNLKEGAAGTLVVGFTKENPAHALEKLKTDRLPTAAIPHLTKNKGYWAMQVRVPRLCPQLYTRSISHHLLCHSYRRTS